MKTHSAFPASSAARLIACPGSFRLTKELVDAGQYVDRPSVYAAQGTVAHAIAEDLLAHRGDPVEQDALLDAFRQPIVYDGHVIVPDDDFLDHVQTYTKYVETLEAFDYELAFEQKVSPGVPWWVRGEMPPVDLYGTADCYGVNRKHGDIVVIDLKFGSGVKVNVEDNPQLLYYALGVISELAKTLPKDSLPPRDCPVELVVIQPRIQGGHEPKLFNTTVGEVVAWGEFVLKPAVEACLDPLATLNAGDHCKFCPARTVCPELKNLAAAKIRELFDDGGVQALDMKALYSNKLAEDLLLIAPLEAWIEGLREEAIRRLTDGKLVPGHKLVAKRAIRKWTDEMASKQACVAAAEVGVNLMEVEVVSPARAERMAKNVDFSPYWTKQSSGVTLAREDDPRPAAEPPRSTLLQDLKGSLQ